MKKGMRETELSLGSARLILTAPAWYYLQCGRDKRISAISLGDELPLASLTFSPRLLWV